MSWEEDWSEDFVNLVSIPPSMITHMRNAVATSYFKYGSIKTYPVEKMKQRMGQAWKEFRESKNHEKLVDIANYCMFLYLLDVGDRGTYVSKAEDVAAFYEEAKYKGTDRGKGLKSVSDWLREAVWDD